MAVWKKERHLKTSPWIFKKYDPHILTVLRASGREFNDENNQQINYSALIDSGLND